MKGNSEQEVVEEDDDDDQEGEGEEEEEEHGPSRIAACRFVSFRVALRRSQVVRIRVEVRSVWVGVWPKRDGLYEEMMSLIRVRASTLLVSNYI
uniref:Uncharacterized protein n=1 Tax=Caenorhabditis japonica TaxID=281687 RepID=A0A8R1I9W1_CAEJA